MGQPTADQAFEALGNPIRRELVRRLAGGPRSVGMLAADLPVSRPAVSKHLRLLRAAQLVECERQGTRSLFRLAPAGFDAARSWLESFWDEALERFASVAESGIPDRVDQ